MAFTVNVICPEDFVRIDSDKWLDLPTSRKLIFELGSVMCARGIDHAIIDLRQAKSDLSVTDLYELVTALGEAGFEPSHHLAVLHRPGSREPAEFFSLCASNRGWQVEAFTTFEEAFEWLNRPADAATANGICDAE